MMFSYRSHLLIPWAIAIGASAATSCSAAHAPSGGSSDPAPQQIGVVGSGGSAGVMGSIGLRLSIAPGVTFEWLDWNIANNQGSYSGRVDLGDAGITGNVDFVAGGIPAGAGYVLTLTGRDSNDDPCSGTSQPFEVTKSVTVSVSLTITCTIPTDAAEPADVQTAQ